MFDLYGTLGSPFRWTDRRGRSEFQRMLAKDAVQQPGGSHGEEVRMKSWLSAVFVLGACMLLGTSALAGASPSDQGAPAALPAVFRGDTRLQAKVTTTFKDRPLGEVLALLGREIDVPLRARPETADDKVTLFVDQRAAAEVLSLLARQFHFRWFRFSHGYELGQDSVERSHEAALRRADEAAEWSRLRAWIDRLDGLLHAPSEQLQARSKEVAARLKDAGLAEDERSRLSTARQSRNQSEGRRSPSLNCEVTTHTGKGERHAPFYHEVRRPSGRHVVGL